ncbi:MAG: prealbumin-like fold domain-containing protein [Cytophagales bacterium]|nr:prealbumin-like fold domain-containing protein [Cytophagales bacterium]
MKKFLFSIFLSLMMWGGFTAEAQILPTKLKITILDETGNIVKGAQVVLYEKKKDYYNEKNPVFTGKTDMKGRVTFKKLKPIAYYVMAKKGKRDNQGGGEVTGKLRAGRVNKNTIVIQ